jgi:hypothetical protein
MPFGQPIEMAGRIMTGFLRIAPEGYQTEAALEAWLNRALDVVATLTAKGSFKTPPQRESKADVGHDRPGVDAEALAYMTTVKRPWLGGLYVRELQDDL